MIGKKNILITGCEGQLGRVIQNYSKTNNNYNYYFVNKVDMDISVFEEVLNFIKANKINIVINCAALTNVDFAENNKDLANLINNISVKYLVDACQKNNAQLIHFSTDYVFSGKKKSPYNENDKTQPINFYGLSKLNGEKKMLDSRLKNSLIIRTSWLYSYYGNNFIKKLLNISNKKNNIEIIKNKFGSPTNASDLVEALFEIMPKIRNDVPELLHFSNKGFTSRVDFARTFFKLVNKDIDVTTVDYFSECAERPDLSALDSKLFSSKFNIKIEHWKSSLKRHVKKNIFVNNEV